MIDFLWDLLAVGYRVGTDTPTSWPSCYRREAEAASPREGTGREESGTEAARRKGVGVASLKESEYYIPSSFL